MKSFIPEPSVASNPYLDRIRLVQGDLTRQDTQAIVSVLPQNLEYKGRLNTAILAAAGEKLDEFVLENIFKPRPGDIYAVPGFNLPARHIFFCILPKWQSSFDREEKYLVNVSRKAMELARSMCLRSVAFPLLAAGKDGYPEAKAARLIVQGITERLDDSIEDVRLVCPEAGTLSLFQERLKAAGWKKA